MSEMVLHLLLREVVVYAHRRGIRKLLRDRMHPQLQGRYSTKQTMRDFPKTFWNNIRTTKLKQLNDPEEFHAFIRKVSLGNGLESRTELVARQDGKKKEGKQ